MIKCLFSVLLFFTVTLYGLRAQEDAFNYTGSLTISDGLVHNGITSIYEDSRGLMWIGSYDGLNLYDGYEVKSFKNTTGRGALVSNRVRALNEDGNGRLWIGTDHGITVFDYDKNRFKTIYSYKLNDRTGKGPIIRDILVDSSEGLVFCSTEGHGVIVFNENYEIISTLSPKERNDDASLIFYEGLKLSKDHYLFCSSEGLFLLEIASGRMKRMLPENISSCQSIAEIKENKFLVAAKEGVVVFEYKPDISTSYLKFLFKDLSEFHFNRVGCDRLGGLWMGTVDRGLVKIDDLEAFCERKSYRIAKFTDESSILRISYIFISPNCGAWIGTFDEGIFRFKLKANPFKYYHPNMDFPYGIKSKEVLQIHAYDDHRAFVSSNKGGVGLFNTQNNRFEPLPFDLPSRYAKDVGFSFLDSRGNIWMDVNDGGGFVRVRPGQRRIETIDTSLTSALMEVNPWAFAEDRQGDLWLGCEKNAYRISFDANNEVTRVESLNDHPFFAANKVSLVRDVYEDPLYGFIWVATHTDGLLRLKVEEGQLLKDVTIDQYLHNADDPSSISSDFVTSVLRLPNGELWVGTEMGGICKVLNSDLEPKFLSFSEKQGLSNHVVKSIMYDDAYNLWISTNIGLNLFDTKEYQFKKFHEADGLPFEDFMYASEKLKNGNFIFGGLDGFFCFDPRNVAYQEALPNLIFGDLEVYDTKILPGDTLDRRILLKNRLSDGDEVVLNHDENVFSVEVLSLHYSSPGNHYLKYKLSPINDEWLEVPSDQRFINYAGLQPGDYSFQVMASNSFNEYSEPLQLFITVEPPFWYTKTAYFLYFIGLGVLFYVVLSVVIKIQSLKHRFVIEKMEKENVKKLNDEKLRFFGNISHEIKTPLTLIFGPVNSLVKQFKGDGSVSGKLTLVQRQLKRIAYLLDQVLDFQRSEANSLKMNYSTFCFDIFIRELSQDFDFLAGQEHKVLSINGEAPSSVYVYADRDKLEKIFYNLLNNAFKYTKAGDEIRVTYRVEANNLVVSIRDTGLGIEKEDLAHVFERFYQSQKMGDRYYGGSGIGLAFTKRLVEMHYGYIEVESEPEEGTNFSLRLPVLTEELTQEQREKTMSLLAAAEEEESHPQFVEVKNLSEIHVDEEFKESHVFFVEDNVELRAYVAEVLSSFFKVTAFANGSECLVAMEKEWPDIVVSDVMMPMLNGFDLCTKIKSDIKTSHIPVVLLTACVSVDDQIKGIRGGADAYIEKPFDFEYLITTVETLLRSRKQLHERFSMDIPLTLEQDKNSANDLAFLEKLYNLMEKNLDRQDLDLADFARDLYLNRTYFFQKVKVLTNYTPFELLKAYRLKRAAELLVRDKIPVAEVALKTGFKSRTHFSKIFKDKYGSPPAKYAAEINKKESDSQA